MNEDYTFALREDIDTIKMMSTMSGSFMCDDIFPKFIPDGDLHRLFYKVKMVATIFSQF